ncbi:MAG TPA: anti-virulence regulator CigR family protein [Kiloniellaceae bacterium]
MLRTLSVVLALLLALGTPALADPGKGKSKGNAAEATTDDIVEGVVAGVLNAVLTDDERRIIHEYFHDHAGNFGKVKPLPPGIRKKLARGGAMPPGIAKQALPGDLYRRLPPRDGQHYEIVGTDVVLVQVATQVIVDVLKDVLRGS